jgi:hypothetical protein
VAWAAWAVWTCDRRSSAFDRSPRRKRRAFSLLGARGNSDLAACRLPFNREGQFLGDEVPFSRLDFHMRQSDMPTRPLGYFVGASAEAGSANATCDTLRAESLRAGLSVFVDADSGIGPLHVGLTHALRGQTDVVLFNGRT